MHKELKLFNKSLDDYNKVLSFNNSQSHTLYNEALFNKDIFDLPDICGCCAGRSTDQDGTFQGADGGACLR